MAPKTKEKTPSAPALNKTRKAKAPKKTNKKAAAAGPLIYPVISEARILSDMWLYARTNGGTPTHRAARALAGALEYIGADLLERACALCKDDPESNDHISCRHFVKSIRADAELAQIFIIEEHMLESAKKRHRAHKKALTALPAETEAATPEKPKKAAAKPKKTAAAAEAN
jgi:hypothetical protein